MNATERMTYFTTNAAEEIAGLIEIEDRKMHGAQSKQEEYGPLRRKGSDAARRTAATKYSAAKRDEHRARTSLMAYKTALRIVLLEHECRRVSGPVQMPDPDSYLMNRRLNPPTY